MVAVSDIRERAKRLYEELPLPSSKYTALTWWNGYSYPEETKAHIEINLPKGVEILEEGTVGDIVPPNAWKFVAFHYMNLSTPIILKVPEGVKAGEPARIKVFVEGREHFHLQVEMAPGSKLDVVLEVAGKGLYTEVVEAKVGEGASLTLSVVEAMEEDSVLFVDRGMVVDGRGTGKLVGAWFGGKFVMGKHKVMPVGSEANVEDVQVLFGYDSQHYDLTTYLNFTAPMTKGESTIRAVLKDTARAVLYGMIDVQHEVQHADAYLSEHTLLLNSGARADSIPGLEIMTDEVRATHGATVGPIDEEKIFYLMSRGLSRTEAQKLIVAGFFEPALGKIGIEEVRGHVEEVIERRMGQ